MSQITNKTATHIIFIRQQSKVSKRQLPGLLSNWNIWDFLSHRLDLPRPLPRFLGGNSDVNGTEDEIGIGGRVTARVPSGLYFLGLPLFFFSCSEEVFSAGIVKLNGGAATFSVTAATEVAAETAAVVGGPKKGLGLSGRGGGSIE